MGESEYDKIPKEIRDFIPDFLSESEENLRILNEKLLECEEAFKQKKPVPPDSLNSLFRAAHSIKGTASLVGLDKIV
ncbi:MAG: Hpt domain-containing protein, partial [Candidatus Omnitrophota bacterium]